MKNVISCMLLMSFLTLQISKASDIVVPKPVSTAFAQQYPNAEEVSWEEVDQLFIADFYDDDYSKKASYDLKGKWVKTYTDLVDEYGLPENIVTFITEKYEGVTFNQAGMTENPESGRYDISIEINDKTIQMAFDLKGNLLEEN